MDFFSELINRKHTIIVAEIGINHNGDIIQAKKLIDAAICAGVDAVKFQKRTPELCVPESQRQKMRDTPWGYISYMEYRNKVEFGLEDYLEIDRYCKEKGIIWFASCWDIPSIEFISSFSPLCYKIPSACITDYELLKCYRDTGKLLIMSSGMSTTQEIIDAVKFLGEENLILCHSTSTYPCELSELNLKMIHTLKNLFSCPVGYSGHEVGLAPSIAAVALGACYIERHITLDRSLWGTDQAASVEPQGFQHLVKYVRAVEIALGDGIKKVYDSERPIKEKLRINTK